jgi:hypothetical protein
VNWQTVVLGTLITGWAFTVIVPQAVSLHPLPSVNIVLIVYVPCALITAAGKLTVAVVPPIALNVPLAQFWAPLPIDHA